MEIYEYERINLEGPAFRLLRLIRGGDSDIECELFQAWLHNDSAISYEALSYTWGDTQRSASIKIDGKNVGITGNLYLALQYLRSQEIDRILWVDAICINQDSKEERTHQVRQMGNIYSQATLVIFWLGSGTDETRVLMNSLKLLEKESTGYACRDWGIKDKRWMDLWFTVQPILRDQHLGLAPRQLAGLKVLLGQPWFKRVWILQEVANAKTAIVCSGAMSVSARIFALAPFLMDTNPEPYCQAVLDIMPGPSRKDSWWSQRRDLYTLLLKFSGSKASDSRDMIYALLGISSDAQGIHYLSPEYTKHQKQLVYDAALFLFGFSSVPFHTIPELLSNFTSLNAANLSRIARICNANNVAEFLIRRGDNVKITVEVVEAAAENTKSGKEVMGILLQQRGGEVRITEEVIIAAAGNEGSGKEVMELLFKQRRGEVKMTEGVVRAAAGNSGNGEEVMNLLFQRRGRKVKITEGVVRAAAGNAGSGKEVMGLLLQRRGHQVKITEGVVRAAAGNLRSGKEVIDLLDKQRGKELIEVVAQCGPEVMALLLEQRGGEAKIIGGVVRAAAGYQRSGEEEIDLLFQQQGLLEALEITDRLIAELARSFGANSMALLLQQRGSEVKITEEVVRAAARNWHSGKEVMDVLLQQRGGEVKITGWIVKAAAGNWYSGKEVMNLLLQQRGSEVRITEGVVIAAAGNEGSGKEVMDLLLKQRGGEVTMTERVVRAAAGNAGSGKEVMDLLLQRRGRQVKITEGVVNAAAGNWHSGKEVIELLLQQRRSEVKITKGVVRAAEGNAGCGKEVMDLLLQHRGIGTAGRK